MNMSGSASCPSTSDWKKTASFPWHSGQLPSWVLLRVGSSTRDEATLERREAASFFRVLRYIKLLVEGEV